jgi:hypothetical protein
MSYDKYVQIDTIGEIAITIDVNGQHQKLVPHGWSNMIGCNLKSRHSAIDIDKHDRGWVLPNGNVTSAPRPKIKRVKAISDEYEVRYSAFDDSTHSVLVGVYQTLDRVMRQPISANRVYLHNIMDLTAGSVNLEDRHVRVIPTKMNGITRDERGLFILDVTFEDYEPYIPPKVPSDSKAPGELVIPTMQPVMQPGIIYKSPSGKHIPYKPPSGKHIPYKPGNVVGVPGLNIPFLLNF